MKRSLILPALLLVPGAAGADVTPRPPTKAQAAAAKANAIAFKFNAKAQETPGNVFFSPYSLYTAFSMVYEGARGGTAEEMRNVFGFSADSATLHGDSSLLRKGLAKAARGSEFSQANALWLQLGFNFLPEFTGAVKRYYGASVEAANFRSAPGKAVNDINSWTRRKTGGKISGLFDASAITPLTRLVLANAVYFKGRWKAPFKAEGTSEQDFTLGSGEKAKVPMMDSAGAMKAGYFEDAELQALGLSYEGGTLRMLVLLPRPGKSAAGIAGTLTQERVSDVEKRLGQGTDKVQVYLPRFKFASSWALNSMLSALGMPGAFAQGADLSGIDGTTTFYLQQAAQKAYVEVNEEGTEAAAATGVSAMLGSARSSRPKVFRADRPFVFLIEDARSGLILFMGRVEDPRKSE